MKISVGISVCSFGEEFTLVEYVNPEEYDKEEEEDDSEEEDDPLLR